MIVRRKCWVLIDRSQINTVPKIFRTKALATEAKRRMRIKYKNHMVEKAVFEIRSGIHIRTDKNNRG